MSIARILTEAANVEDWLRDAPWYLAGKMTGVPQFNFPLFFKAANQLRAHVRIVSPAEIDDPATREAALASPDGAPGSGVANDETYGDFMARDVKIVIDQAAGVILLPYWFDSTGATIEAFTALRVGKPVFEYWPDEDRVSPTPLDLTDLWAALQVEPVSAVPDPVPDTEPYTVPPLLDTHDTTDHHDPRSWPSRMRRQFAKGGFIVNERKTIAQEADDIIAGARQSQYGHPIEDFQRTAGAINAMFGTDLGPMDIPQLMILLKLSRIRQSPFKRDSWVDIDGYAGTAEMVAEKLGRPLE